MKIQAIEKKKTCKIRELKRHVKLENSKDMKYQKRTMVNEKRIMANEKRKMGKE